MSVPATGGVPTGGAGEELVELPPSGDAAFGALMDALAPEPGGEGGAAPAGEAGAGAEAPSAGGADTGGAGAGAAGLPTAGDARVGGAPDGATDTGAAGGEGAAAGGAEQPAGAAGAGDRPATWTAPATDFVPKLGELSTSFEETTTKAYQQQAFEAVREEHGRYFEALNKHPRLLVGQQVPAIGREGTETLRDTNDAREWQDAVKSILTDEIRDRAQRDLEENRGFLDTVHASIDLFKNNVDLIPGTKDFDVELANQFAALAKPYEVRVEGKLQGYSIPVQPIIEQLRTQVSARRAATQPPAAAGQPSTKPPQAAAGTSTAEPPQAGIRSKAGNSGEKEDFSTLFGTIGLPNLQI